MSNLIDRFAARATVAAMDVAETRKRLANDEGATAVEYAILVGTIAVVIIVIVVLFRNPLRAIFNTVLNGLNSVTAT